MRQRLVGIVAIAVLLSGIWATTVLAENFLEAGIDKYESSGSFVYDVFMEANKDGATTCQLVTPIGTYSFTDVGGAFRPEQDFFNDHIGLSFAGLQAAIAQACTMIWDAGPTQTVVSIDFGTISESDFLLIPTLTAPLDGVPIEIPRDPNPPTIEWTNGSAPRFCDFALVFLADQQMWWNAQTLIVSGELSCNTTSWTPASPLTEGTWFITVMNAYAARDVPVGITVVQGTWPLDNSDWLDLSSIDRSQNELVPAESSSWGTSP